jgi:hypothetical protein
VHYLRRWTSGIMTFYCQNIDLSVLLVKELVSSVST